MNLLQNGVIAMLAAVGLSTLVWLVVSTVTRLGYHPAMPMWFVIPARGDAPELQQTVHELERLRRELRCCPPIVILDQGLSDEARRVAELLCAEDQLVRLRREDETINE